MEAVAAANERDREERERLATAHLAPAPHAAQYLAGLGPPLAAATLQAAQTAQPPQPDHPPLMPAVSTERPIRAPSMAWFSATTPMSVS